MRAPLAASTRRAFVTGFLLVSLFAVLLNAGRTVAEGPSTAPEAALTVGSGGSRAPKTPRPVDDQSLGPALEAAGVSVPDGANIYAAIVHLGSTGPSYDQFEAGGGAQADDFWPASSVKPLAAVGALEFLGQLGFTGAATVTFDDGGDTWNVRDLYVAAITDSSNDAYDRLVQIAGVDWLNATFLTPENGFPDSVIQKSYVDAGPVSSPPMEVQEAGRVVDLPARTPTIDLGVPDSGNRSNLAELTDSVVRVAIDGELPNDERFAIDPADVRALAKALLEADGFLLPGVVSALGPSVQVYDKPGYVVGDACVDVAYVDDPGRSASFILGVSTPDDAVDCATLADIAAASLDFLTAHG